MISSLSQIKYQDVITYTDLDQFEEINCDFENAYRWLRTQEAPDTTGIKSIKILDKENTVVTLMSGRYNIKNNTYSYYTSILVYTKK